MRAERHTDIHDSRTLNRGTIKRGKLIAGQLIAWTRAESVTENRNRYRDILKNRNRHRRRYLKNRKTENRRKKYRKKTENSLFAGDNLLISSIFIFAVNVKK